MPLGAPARFVWLAEHVVGRPVKAAPHLPQGARRRAANCISRIRSIFALGRGRFNSSRASLAVRYRTSPLELSPMVAATGRSLVRRWLDRGQKLSQFTPVRARPQWPGKKQSG